jgi:hypothetical protein
MIYRVPPSSSPTLLPGGFSFSFLQNTTSVASLRYAGSLALKAEVFTVDEEAARNLTDSAAVFLAAYRSASEAAGRKGTDHNVNAAFESIQVKQEGSRTVFTATLTQEFVRKIWQETGRQQTSGAGKP